MSEFALDGTETCSKKELIIEVLGKNYDDTQKVQIITSSNSAKDPDETMLLQNERTLNIWQAEGDYTTTSANIVIKSEQGDIHLQAFERIYPTERCEKYHDYIIAPFVPLVKIGEKGQELAHARDGFIYIFIGSKVWREVLVSFNENGLPIYKDTLLTKVRAENPEAKIPSEYERPAIGLDMDAIWLPVCDDQSSSRYEWHKWKKPRVFYSEVQLSAERITYLEDSEKEGGYRPSKSDLDERAIEVSKFYSLKSYPWAGDLADLKGVKPQRSRSTQGMVELMFAEPEAYLHDLSGCYAIDLLKLAEQELNSLESAEGPCGHHFHKELENRAHSKRDLGKAVLTAKDVFARNHALTLSQHRTDDNSEATNTENPNDVLWEAHDSEEDVFKQARERKYVGLVLQDELFDLRHHIDQASRGLDYINELQSYIAKHTHFNFAQYVNHLLLSPDDPRLRELNKKYGDKVHQGPTDPFTRILIPELRSVARNVINNAQYKAQSLLTDIVPVLRDLFSLNNEDYAAGHLLVSKWANSVLYSPEGIDSLYNKAKKQRINNRMIEFVERVDHEHPLGRMIYPEPKKVPTDAPFDYQACLAEGLEENKGDGCFRLNALLMLSLGRQVSHHPLQTLDVIMAASLDQSLAENGAPIGSYLTGAKRFFNDFANISSGLIVAGQAYLSYLKYSKGIMEITSKTFLDTFRLNKITDVENLSKMVIKHMSEPLRENYVIVGIRTHGVDLGVTAKNPSLTIPQKKLTVGVSGEAPIVAHKREEFNTPLKGTPRKQIKKSFPQRTVSVFMAPKGSEVAKFSQSEKVMNSQFGAKLERGLLKVSPLLLFLEVWNLEATLSNSDGNRSERDTFAKYGSILDLALISERALYLCNKQNIVSRTIASNTVSTGKGFMLEHAKPGSLMHKIGVRLPPAASLTFGFGVLSGVITVGVYIADSINDWNERDYDAAYANAVAAAGAATGTGALILGMCGFSWAGPVVWLSIAVSAIAAIVATILDDDEIETLLEHGPLSRVLDKEEFTHLHRENEALYRLISHIIKPEISISNNPHPNYNKLIKIASPFSRWVTSESINTDIQLLYRKGQFNERQGDFHYGDFKIIPINKMQKDASDSGLEIFLSLPESHSEVKKVWLMETLKNHEYKIKVKYQIVGKIRDGNVLDREWVFPSPIAKLDSKFTDTGDRANFSDKDQAFWYFKEISL
ncbi:hypothetical protein [Enterovibrio norvegicus]|uniref:hypothetical protein n=1 Tax=Enterovibrio norvegicus TaxID=188144 RepID=UPI000C820D7E|nr:hypothetical protein [Enterovibrio norvegicus]PML79211.1 hypothetical protein BCT69_14610 [Enterovibrio norvegicus]